MKELTDEQIEAVAKRTQDEWIAKGCPAGRMFRQAIRKALSLAAEDDDPDPFDCETCKYAGTSLADPPCRDCANGKPMKWEPKPSRKPLPVGPFEVVYRSHGSNDPVWFIEFGDGDDLCECFDKSHAFAIAFALKIVPECKAVLEAHQQRHPACQDCIPQPIKDERLKRDALLAEFDKWDMPTP